MIIYVFMSINIPVHRILLFQAKVGNDKNSAILKPLRIEKQLMKDNYYYTIFKIYNYVPLKIKTLNLPSEKQTSRKKKDIRNYSMHSQIGCDSR